MKQTEGSTLLVVLAILSGCMLTLSIYWRSIVYATELVHEQQQWYATMYKAETLTLWGCSICIQQFDTIVQLCKNAGGTCQILTDDWKTLNNQHESSHVEIKNVTEDTLKIIGSYKTQRVSCMCIRNKDKERNKDHYAISEWDYKQQ